MSAPLNLLFRGKRYRVALGVTLLGLSAAACWSLVEQRERMPPLQIRFAGKCSKPDYGTASFQLSCAKPCSIFLATATVEVPQRWAWRPETTYGRGEIVRLKANIPYEICVEPPRSGDWRVSISYGTEMHGSRLLLAQMREAWKIKSFSNWTGRPWGGGHFSGSWTLASEEVRFAHALDEERHISPPLEFPSAWRLEGKCSWQTHRLEISSFIRHRNIKPGRSRAESNVHKQRPIS
jgi:hypothetical protein